MWCVRSKFIIYPDVTVTINLGDRGCLMQALTLRQCDADRRDAGRILFAIRMYLCTRQTEHDCPAQCGGGPWIASLLVEWHGDDREPFGLSHPPTRENSIIRLRDMT